MPNRPLSMLATTATLMLALTAAPALTQESASPGDDENFTAPRTSWGDPDLRGMWPLESIGGTPLERPAALGEQAHYTDEQYAALSQGASPFVADADAEEDAGKLGIGHWFELGARPLRQTSLIIEPANGRMPPLTEEGERRSAAMKSSWSEEVFDDLSDFNALDRCITRGLPASMVTFPYNNGVEIFQSPGYVVVNMELIHETRIIPLDGRPPIPSSMPRWLGESRGTWEGDALVVETTNFTGETPMNIVGPGNKPIPTSDEMRVVERFELTGPDTLQYTMRVEDPVVLTAPWTMSYPIARDESYEAYEYACHEANTVVPAYIRATSPRFYTGESEAFDTQEWLRLQAEGSRPD